MKQMYFACPGRRIPAGRQGHIADEWADCTDELSRQVFTAVRQPFGGVGNI